MAKKKARKQLKYTSVCDRKWQRLRLLPSVDVEQAKDTSRIVPGTRRLNVTYGCMATPRCVEQLASRLRWFAASRGKLELVALKVEFFPPSARRIGKTREGASERGTITIIDLVQPAGLELHVAGPVDDARLGRILSHQRSPMTLTMWCALGATGAFLELARPAPPLEILTVWGCPRCHLRECWATVGAGLRDLSRYPRLCRVTMTSLNFTDESAIALAGARGLREVSVDVSHLTSKGKAALAAITGLRQLILRMPIDDSICRILAKNDTVVDLEVGSITRRCLSHLAEMKSLRFRRVWKPYKPHPKHDQTSARPPAHSPATREAPAPPRGP